MMSAFTEDGVNDYMATYYCSVLVSGKKYQDMLYNIYGFILSIFSFHKTYIYKHC